MRLTGGCACIVVDAIVAVSVEAGVVGNSAAESVVEHMDDVSAYAPAAVSTVIQPFAVGTA